MTDSDLEERWANVLARWEDPAAHAEFVEACHAALQLGFAAKRYREIATSGQAAYRNDVQRVETAQQRLRGITALAMTNIQAAGHGAPVTAKSVRLGAFAVFALLIALATAVLHSFR